MESSSQSGILFVAIGNPIRRDDGVAARVLQLLPGCSGHVVHQLTPEMAALVAGCAEVVFLDADAGPGDVRLERVEGKTAESHLTHQLSPSSVVGLARELFGFSGDAWLCRIPAANLTIGEGLSARGELAAQTAARLLGSIFDL